MGEEMNVVIYMSMGGASLMREYKQLVVYLLCCGLCFIDIGMAFLMVLSWHNLKLRYSVSFHCPLSEVFLVGVHATQYHFNVSSPLALNA